MAQNRTVLLLEDSTIAAIAEIAAVEGKSFDLVADRVLAEYAESYMRDIFTYHNSMAAPSVEGRDFQYIAAPDRLIDTSDTALSAATHGFVGCAAGREGGIAQIGMVEAESEGGHAD